MSNPNDTRPNQTQLLLAIFQDVAEIKAAISQVKDHEDRIRELEKWKFVLAGVAVASGGLGAAITKLLGV